MNKTPRLSKSGIEYMDYSWGIFSGCRNLQIGVCPVKACWAKAIASRFLNHYPNGFEPTFYPEAMSSPRHLRKPSRIGVGWVGDVIGYGLEYKELIYRTIRACPQHTFLFLTKNPEKLIDWSPFPDNCWVGMTATDARSCLQAFRGLEVIKAKVKFISLEPFLDHIGGLWMERWLKSGVGINQVIIGSQTKPYRPPAISDVREIVEACDKAGVKVFLKNNLKKLIEEAGMGKAEWAAKEWVQCKYPVLMQEMPTS